MRDEGKSFRLLLFFLVCIPVRVGIAVFTFYLSSFPEAVRVVVAGILAAVALSFALQHAVLKRSIGAFGQRVWWGGLRPFHFVTYFLASLFLLVSPPREDIASYILFSDAGVSCLASLSHYLFR